MGNDKTDDPVRERAYQLWEEHGKPEGSAMDFWLQAERELVAERMGQSQRDKSR